MKALRKDYDLVASELRTPGKDGLEPAEAIKSRRSWTPVLIVTRFGDDAAVPPETMTAEVATPEAGTETPSAPSRIKDVALFVAAPFIGLVYAVFMPVIGLGMAAWLAARALAKYPAMRSAGEVMLDVGKFAAAPFIGLAYAVLMPFVGLAMLGWFAARAAAKHTGLRTIARAVFGPLVGLAFVTVLPFAGLATLAWIGGRALRETRRAA